MRSLHALKWLPKFRIHSHISQTRHSSAVRNFGTTASSWQEERKWSTPLAKQLHEAITTTGPVPLASYMRMCLTGDVGGYYTGAIGDGRDQFGRKGDFVTSPEISQVFGELIAIWFIAEWMSQGRPSHGVQLIELGPGRGTLMDDMLRTIQRFPEMANSLQAVYMVETSRELRESQKSLLCGPDSPSTESKAGRHSSGKYGGTPIVWTETIKSIPIESDKTPFIIAHEFFDALPIHTFQSAPRSLASSTANANANSNSNSASAKAEPAKLDLPSAGAASLEWRELMVAPTHEAHDTQDSANPGPSGPEFQLIRSSTTTRHSRYVPESSPRYRKLKQTPDAVIEVCPDASLYAADFAARIGGSSQHPKSKASGAALVLDYGTLDTVPVNSLRGIRHHEMVNPFAMPGLVDLSADVDFTAIAETALSASEGVEVHGPVTQADFLESMGIQQRADMLATAPGVSKERAEQIHGAWKRLVDKGPSGMGRVYKALAIVPENDGRRRPVGFGGDIM